MAENKNEYKLGDMLKAFPMADLAKMMTNIDRFEPAVPKERKDELDAIAKSEEISQKIIEEDM